MHSYLLNKLLNGKLIVFLLILIFFFVLACKNDQSQVDEHANSTLRGITGSPTRIVWVQDLLDNKDVVAEGNHLRLMGYDSEVEKGERVILSGPENFMRPLITPSGRQVIFSNFQKKNVQIVDWSGQNRKILTNGLALTTWRDPADGVEWAYVARSPLSESRGPTFQHLYRVQIQNPSLEELVWDKTVFGAAVHLSRDGRRFSAEIPWPDCAVIDLEREEARRYGKGCWPALAPDQSYRFWIFDGAHRNLEMFDTRNGTQNRVNISGAPGVDGNEVYHPRWSNHPRYMVMTGPYTILFGGNNIRGGGEGVEIYAGRFNKDFTAIEAWFRVTNNQRADFYPDMWVSDENYFEQSQTADNNASIPDAQIQSGLTWPVELRNLLFAWKDVKDDNEWRSQDGKLYQAEMVPEGLARFAINYQMRLGTGWFSAKRSPEPEAIEYAVPKGFTLEFVITVPQQKALTASRLLSLGPESGLQIILSLDQGDLLMTERQLEKFSQTLSFGELPIGKSHVMLTVAPEKITLLLNGEEQTYQRHASVVVPWPLTVGNIKSKSVVQAGMLEGIALYVGVLNRQKRLQAFNIFSQIQKEVNKRKPIVVRAELISSSPVPAPEDILPYRRGLVVNEYRIIEQLQGDIPGQDILVAHWAILDGKRLAGTERTLGKVYTLKLDSFDDRPELEGERLSMELENLLLPMYYDIDS